MIKNSILLSFIFVLSCNNIVDVEINMKDKYAFVNRGIINEMSITLTNDTSYYAKTTSYKNSAKIYFKEYLDSVLKKEDKNSRLNFFFKINNSSGNHIYSFFFKLKEVDSLPSKIVLKEIHE